MLADIPSAFVQGLQRNADGVHRLQAVATILADVHVDDVAISVHEVGGAFPGYILCTELGLGRRPDNGASSQGAQGQQTKKKIFLL